MPSRLKDLSRLCVHSISLRPLSLPDIVKLFSEEGIPGITVWREHVEPLGTKEASQILRDSGLNVVSLCRGGFFPARSAAARTQARVDTLKAIDEAHEIGAPLLILVCGAAPKLDLNVARQQIADGIASVLPHAKQAGVKLAIEPLHPMYADTRSAIISLEQANNLVFSLNHPNLGVAIDVYHVWWDPYLKSEIDRARGHIFAFHVSDWRVPTRDLLYDRALMGEGCINIPEIRSWVEQSNFHGWIEVEILSEELWQQEPRTLLRRIKHAYLHAV